MDNLAVFISICSHVDSFSHLEMKEFFDSLLNEFDEVTALRFFAGGYATLRKRLPRGQLKRIEQICLAIVTKRPPKSKQDSTETKNEDDCMPITLLDIASDNLSLTCQFLPLWSWIRVQRVCREFCIVARRPSSRTFFGDCTVKWNARESVLPMTRVCTHSIQNWKYRTLGQYSNATIDQRFYNFSHVQKFSVQLVPFLYRLPFLQDHLLLASLKHLTHLQYSAFVEPEKEITPLPFLPNLKKLELIAMQWRLMMPVIDKYISQHNLTHIFIGQCTWRQMDNYDVQLKDFLTFILPQVLNDYCERMLDLVLVHCGCLESYTRGSGI